MNMFIANNIDLLKKLRRMHKDNMHRDIIIESAFDLWDLGISMSCPDTCHKGAVAVVKGYINKRDSLHNVLTTSYSTIGIGYDGLTGRELALLQSIQALQLDGLV